MTPKEWAFEIVRALVTATEATNTAKWAARAAVEDGCDLAALAELVGAEVLDGLLEGEARPPA